VPATVTVTESAWVFVMLFADGVTVTVGVALVTVIEILAVAVV
jgi:hypothetical protein